MRHRYKIGLVLVLVCICLLWGCRTTPPEPATEPTIPSYTVQFMVAGEEYTSQQVRQGSTPAAVVPEIKNCRFAEWLDESGAAVVPEELSVSGNVTYYAKCYPDLSSHVPYLFVDENGFLRPDDSLIVAEMTKAFAALASESMEAFSPIFIGLPKSEEPVTGQVLHNCLTVLFPEDAVQRAMSLVSGETVTRGDFATVMNVLTQRSLETSVSLSSQAEMPLDLSADHEMCAALMEASLDHSHGPNAISWDAAAKSLKRAPGFMNLNGWLYYVNESGTVIRNAQVGQLTFGVDGRYTSSDPELDTTVAGILADIIAKNPNAPRIDLLRRAFEYSRDSFTYLRRSAYEFGAAGWEIEDAKKMFDTAKGNCYNFAASFWALARGLGYEAKCISGTMTRTDQPHSWVEIVMEDGKPYIFDPQMEYAYVHERDIFDKDMFMVTYAAGAWWNYKRP